MNGKIRSVFFICLGLLFGMSVMYIYNNFIADKKGNTETTKTEATQYKSTSSDSEDYNNPIVLLTDQTSVINYVKRKHKLPDYYITKNEARKHGWNPSKGNLCEILPGKAIGGDHFSNREKKLPQGEKYFEADVNYNCGNRNSDRIIFTGNGDVYLTKNHYKSFEKQ